MRRKNKPAPKPKRIPARFRKAKPYVGTSTQGQIIDLTEKSTIEFSMEPATLLDEPIELPVFEPDPPKQIIWKKADRAKPTLVSKHRR